MFKQQNIQMVFNNLQDKLSEYKKRLKQDLKKKHMEIFCPRIERYKNPTPQLLQYRLKEAVQEFI